MTEKLPEFSPKCRCTACKSLDTTTVSTLIKKRRRFHKCKACGHRFRSEMLDHENYEKSTVRLRKPKKFEWNGQKKTIKELASEAGIKEKTLRTRLHRGMTLAEAMTVAFSG